MQAAQYQTAPQRFCHHGMYAVPDIAPVDGWVLWTWPETDGDGFETDAYFARGPHTDVALDVSRFRFTPSQERFAWLVRNGFPPRRRFGPWDDTEIEQAMAYGIESLPVAAPRGFPYAGHRSLADVDGAA